MRGRYNEDNRIEQHIEINGEEVSNTVTTVQKDCLVAEVIVNKTRRNK